jgi:hypothetical protein
MKNNNDDLTLSSSPRKLAFPSGITTSMDNVYNVKMYKLDFAEYVGSSFISGVEYSILLSG